MPWEISKRDGEFCVVKSGTDEVEACHATREKAADHIRALYAAEEDASDPTLADIINLIKAVFPEHPDKVEEDDEEKDEEEEEAAVVLDIETPDPSVDFIPWDGVITVEGEWTGDGRRFKEGSVVWEDTLLPFPFKWQRVSAAGHDASVTIGRVDRIVRSEEGIKGYGVILQGPAAPDEAYEYVELLRAGAAGGVSIDGDDAEFEIIQDGDDPHDMKMVFSKINIRALTAVDIPAFAKAKIQLTDAVVASVIGSTDLPVAARERDYDGLAARDRIWDWASNGADKTFDHAKLARAFLWRDSSGDPDKKGSYKLPFTDIIDGSLVIVPKAVFAAAGAVGGARGGLDVPSDEVPAIRRKLETLYRKIPPVRDEKGHPTPPWQKSGDDNEENAAETDDFSRILREREENDALIAGLAPVYPPKSWFEAPKLAELTPITITDDGRVFGHLAGKDTCHIGLGNCRTSPRSCDYDGYFHLGAVKTEEGDIVNVGHLTFGGGHADLKLNAQAAAEVYDSTSKVGADIRAGEDEFGTWISGALRPGLSEEDVRELRSAPLSGDWRPIGGRLQLIAAHAVNVPGFPISRAKVLVASGATQSIILTEDCSETFRKTMFDLDLMEE